MNKKHTRNLFAFALISFFSLSGMETDEDIINVLRKGLNWAARNGHKERVIELLAQPHIDINALGKFGTTPLIDAEMGDREEIVSILLEHGADPNIQDSGGCTALQRVTFQLGNPALEEALFQRRKKILTTLLAHGANPNIQNNQCRSAHNSASRSAYDIASREIKDIFIFHTLKTEHTNPQSYLSLLPINLAPDIINMIQNRTSTDIEVEKPE